MAGLIYVLCALLSLACAAALWRSYRTRRVRFCLWAALAFLGFSLSNLVVFLDVAVVHDHDLSSLRLLPAAAGLACFIYGLVWEIN